MDFGQIASILLLPVGFYILVKGADWLVDGASSIAKKFQISNLMIGLTIVALGTSLPELVVNVLASARGATDLAIGNIIGSNISNILLILGICAIIYPLSISKGTVWKEIPLNLLAIAALFVLINDVWIDGASTSILSRSDGIMLMFFFIIFLYYSYGIAKNRTLIDEVGESRGGEDEEIEIMPMSKSIFWIVAGIIALPIGSEVIVRGSLTLAEIIGFSESFIGLTLLALGTSAPELATSVVASYKKNADIAIGNVVGSNLFNIFWVLGLSSVIRPLPPSNNINVDILVVGLATLFLFIFTFVSNSRESGWIIKVKREEHTVSRTEGIVFVMMYIAYVIYLVWRG